MVNLLTLFNPAKSKPLTTIFIAEEYLDTTLTANLKIAAEELSATSHHRIFYDHWLGLASWNELSNSMKKTES